MGGPLHKYCLGEKAHPQFAGNRGDQGAGYRDPIDPIFPKYVISWRKLCRGTGSKECFNDVTTRHVSAHTLHSYCQQPTMAWPSRTSTHINTTHIVLVNIAKTILTAEVSRPTGTIGSNVLFG